MTLVAGTYTARAVAGGLGFTKGGKEQVAVELQILDEEFAGETITWFGYFTEGTQERTIDALRTLGWNTNDLDNLDGITENEVRVVLAEEEYEGKTSLKVKWINRVGGLALKTPMTPEQAKAFARQMKGMVLAVAPSGKQAPAGSRPVAKPPTAPATRPQSVQRQQPHRDPDDQTPEALGEDPPF
jgi:hypothetical protein